MKPRAAVSLPILALLVSLSLTSCAVPFLHRGTGGVKAPKAAKDSKTAPEKIEPVAVIEADDAATWFRRAQRQVAADSLGAAGMSLGKALERDAGHSPALALSSKLDFAAGRHAEAIERLAIITREPARFSDEELALLLTGLALHQDAIGQTQAARATLENAPHSEEKRTSSARVYVLLRSESPDDATELARRTLDRDGKSAVNLNNRGITQLRAGDPDAARRLFLEAIDRDKSLAGPYYNLAILEKFYTLDDAAATAWFDAYRERSRADPDGLAEVFRAKERTPVAQSAGAK